MDWAADGQCTKTAPFMLENCWKSCSFCGELHFISFDDNHYYYSDHSTLRLLSQKDGPNLISSLVVTPLLREISIDGVKSE